MLDIGRTRRLRAVRLAGHEGTLAQSRRALLVFAVAGVVILLICALFGSAKAHSFYPYECCYDRDCWPMGLHADAREPAPVETAVGWRLHDGTVVPFSATRPSPDGRFHVCRGGGRLEGPVIVPSERKPCLWAPAPSS